MKKTALSIAFILTWLISAIFVIGMANSEPTYPIPTGPLTPPLISIRSPTSTTYISKFVSLQFSVNGSWDGYVEHCSVAFSVDDETRYVIYALPFHVNRIGQNFSATLGPLSEGKHILKVFATVGGRYRTGINYTTLDVKDFTSQSEVYFSVNSSDQAQIAILSPLNETYNVNRMIPLDFTVNGSGSTAKISYTLDEQRSVIIPRNTSLYGPLSDGLHTLKVYSTFSNILPVFSTVNFTVDTTAPNVSILSLQNKVYNSSNAPLVFTVNETASLITYLMDGKVFTIYGNTTLTGMQDGDHKLIVYATDEAGNAGASETIYFNVKVPLPHEAAFPIIPPMAIVLIGGLSLLIYYRKRTSSKADKH